MHRKDKRPWVSPAKTLVSNPIRLEIQVKEIAAASCDKSIYIGKDRVRNQGYRTKMIDLKRKTRRGEANEAAPETSPALRPRLRRPPLYLRDRNNAFRSLTDTLLSAKPPPSPHFGPAALEPCPIFPERKKGSLAAAFRFRWCRRRDLNPHTR